MFGVVIHVHGIEHDVTTYQDGDFFRLLSPGVYTITVARVEYALRHRGEISTLLFSRLDTNPKRERIFSLLINHRPTWNFD